MSSPVSARVGSHQRDFIVRCNMHGPKNHAEPGRFRTNFLPCYDRWLGPSQPKALELLQPFPGAWLETWPVSSRVNSPRNDDADLVTPLAADEATIGPRPRGLKIGWQPNRRKLTMIPRTGSRLRARLRAGRTPIARSVLVIGCVLGTLMPSVANAQEATPSTGSGDDKIIVLINPNSNAETTRSMTEIAARETEGVAEVEGKSNEGVPPLLTTPQDLQDAISGVVEIGVEAAKDDRVAAIIIAAFGDPGLEELRAKVDVPVFGIREEAFHEAARNGRPFGIATTTPDKGLLESFRRTAAALGYEDLYRGTRVTPGDPKELMKSQGELDAALAEAVRTSVEEDRAQAVIIGGGPLTASALRLQPQFDVPLVVPVIAAAHAAAKKVKDDN
jgi:allantoin racemase